MVNVVPKAVVGMKLSGACPNHARTDIAVRDVSIIIDEPVERGGTNQGPTPTETLISALIGCTNVILNRIAHKADIVIENLAVEADAQFDRRGTMLQEEVAVPFPVVRLQLNFASSASAEQIDTLKRELAMFCPIAKVLREAGTRIEENWQVSALAGGAR